MSLKTFFMNIITFGWHSYKKLHALELEKKAITEAAPHDYASELKLAIKRTSEIQAQYKSLPPRMVLVEPFEIGDIVFLQAMQNIMADKSFQFFIYNCQQDIFNMLNNATSEKATEIMGMAKGFKFLLAAMNDLRVAYDTAANPVVESEDSVYV